MLFDSHTHLSFKAFADDRQAVVVRVKDAGMSIMNVGAQYATSLEAVAMALQYQFCYASVGLHPIHVFDEDFHVSEYQQLIDDSQGRVRAIGECGIDYWHIKRADLPLAEVKRKQYEVFRQHIELAKRNDLALMIHGRNGKEDETAYQDIYAITQELGVKRATVHCYGGTLGEAKRFAAAGFFLGITGIITFDKTGRLEEIVRELPLERLLIETDAPYLTPEPYRGQRNEPPYVLEVAKAIAAIKEVTVEKVVVQTEVNAKKLFAIS